MKQQHSPSILADLHAHTSHSHGQAASEAMYLAARDKGLAIFGFSEHSPRPEGYAYPVDYQEKLGRGFDLYVQEVQALALRGKKEGLRVLLGLEADYIRGKEAYVSALRKRAPFDYVIGGLHFQGNWGFDFRPEDWTPLTQKERFAIYARYYEDLAAMCASGLFHIAAHPDLIKLFTVEDFRAWLESGPGLAIVAKALKAIKEQGMLMEVSSAGLRKPCKEIYPGPAIMALAAQMRLPISFGSDAHCVNTPAFAFDQLARYAASFGYKESMIPEKDGLRPLPFAVPDMIAGS